MKSSSLFYRSSSSAHTLQRCTAELQTSDELRLTMSFDFGRASFRRQTDRSDNRARQYPFRPNNGFLLSVGPCQGSHPVVLSCGRRGPMRPEGFRRVPKGSEWFPRVSKGSEGPWRVPKGPEGFRRVPKGPEGFRSVPKGSEGSRRVPKGPEWFRRGRPRPGCRRRAGAPARRGADCLCNLLNWPFYCCDQQWNTHAVNRTFIWQNVESNGIYDFGYQ